MIKVSVVAQHGILIIPKSRQGMRDEMVKRTQRVGTCNGVFKMLQRPKVSVKTCLHQRDDITGDWANGEITGQGVATYANGDVYEGTFQRGKRQGQGTIRFANGNTASGEWNNGALVSNSDQ
ncbi:MAG: hypothetical protein EBY46_13315 [Rhodobacteraceae bacterium]|nr:hypothetical protein [Paracoccaceae bacterium]